MFFLEHSVSSRHLEFAATLSCEIWMFNCIQLYSTVLNAVHKQCKIIQVQCLPGMLNPRLSCLCRLIYSTSAKCFPSASACTYALSRTRPGHLSTDTSMSRVYSCLYVNTYFGHNARDRRYMPIGLHKSPSSSEVEGIFLGTMTVVMF